MGGLFLTFLFVVVVPVISVLLVEPIVNEYLGDTEFGPFGPGMMVTGVMLLFLILFMLLLGGGRIFKKYGPIGVVGLVAAYVLMSYLIEEVSMYDAVLPVLIIIIMVAFTYYRDSKKSGSKKK
jgi:peptidoglycan/LPS O-acetylase OafA/YrhL